MRPSCRCTSHQFIHRYFYQITTVPLQVSEFNLILLMTVKPVTREMFWRC